MTRARRAVGTRIAAAALAALVTQAVSGDELSGQGGGGTLLGVVVAEADGAPLPGVSVRILGTDQGALSTPGGRYLVIQVPPGSYSVSFELIGYGTIQIDEVRIRSEQPTRLDVRLASQAVAVEGITAEVERIRLVEPEVAATHDVFLIEEMRELPVDAVSEVLDLTPGVTDGHFRGGRIGQEVYVVDGLELKNQLEGSSEGVGLELPPSALDEVEVLTGGFGSEYGSAISGVVRFVTRRGDPQQWGGRASYRSDHWTPESVFRGFGELSLSAGGPLIRGDQTTTLRLDLLAQGMRDSDPRARGLGCIELGDGDAAVDGEIAALTSGATASLYCPFSSPSFPHQRGEKLIGFARLDQPLAGSGNLAVTVVRNRLQRQLYSPEFKYNPVHQLGQRSEGTLVMAGVDWARQGLRRGTRVEARVSALRLDRMLGALDPVALDGRTEVGGVGFGSFRFLGEDFTRLPIEEQLRAGEAVPGYEEPGGSVGSPFGPAGEGLFFTTGTPDVAAWNRSEFVGGDVSADVQTATGHRFRVGAQGKAYRIENYERTLAHLAGSTPNFARFFPATFSTFGDARLAAADQVTLHAGVRLEGFRSGLTFRSDRGDFRSPSVETGWRVSVLPRLGVSAPIPGSEGRTAFRFNYSLVAQPPDFQFFLDTTLGDSIRTRVRRQGNPDLSFERGSSFEVGLSQAFGETLGISIVGFRKELTNLVTGSLGFEGFSEGQFTTGDFGSVKGVEATVRARGDGWRGRVAYALQKAAGAVSTAFDDVEGAPQEGEARDEFPLAFDRRHALTVAGFLGRAAAAEERWGLSVIGQAASGVPILRDQVRTGEDATDPDRLPWTLQLDARGTVELGSLPGCDACTWSVLFDARNLLNRENVIAVRPSTGGVGPSADEVSSIVEGAGGPGTLPIPRESPRYSRRIDLDGDGAIDVGEFEAARRAAALDLLDPSLFFGEALQLRLGIEVRFR